MKRALFLLQLAFAWIPCAQAIELPAWTEIGKGRLFAGYFINASPDRFGHADQASLSGTVEARFPAESSWGWRTSLLGMGFLRSIEFQEQGKIQGRVRELYGYHTPPGWDLRVGQMMISWGKTDAVNPTDFLSAKDYRFYTSDSELQRLGTTAAYLAFTPRQGASPFQATAVLQSRFPQTRLLIPEDRLPVGIPFERDLPDPDHFQGNEEWALKLAYLGAAEDASLTFFRGRYHFPQYVLRGSGIRPEFTRQSAVGSDYSKTFEHLIVRAEAAYFLNEGDSRGEGGTGLTQPDHLDAVAGVERPFGEKFRVIAQILWRYHPHFTDPDSTTDPNPLLQSLLRQLGEVNALIQNYQKRSRFGGTLLVAFNDEEKGLTADLSMVGNFAGGDYLLRPRLGYELMTSLQATLGGNFYGGRRDLPLGSLRSYNQFFAEVAYSF